MSFGGILKSILTLRFLTENPNFVWLFGSDRTIFARIVVTFLILHFLFGLVEAARVEFFTSASGLQIFLEPLAVPIPQMVLALIMLIMQLPKPDEQQIEEMLTENKAWERFNFSNQARFRKAVKRARLAILKIRVYWDVTVGIWFVFYGILILKCLFFTEQDLRNLEQDHPNIGYLIKAVLNVFSNATSYTIFLIYLIFSIETWRVDKTGKGKHGHTAIGRSFLWILICYTLVDLTVRGLYVKFPEIESLGRTIFALDCVGALISAVVLSLLAGRLDSKFMMAPTSGIILIYFYAALNAIWPLVAFLDLVPKNSPMFDELNLGAEFSQYLSSIYFTLVFYSKGLFWAFFVYLLRSRNILFYFVRMVSLPRFLDDDLKAYIE